MKPAEQHALTRSIGEAFPLEALWRESLRETKLTRPVTKSDWGLLVEYWATHVSRESWKQTVRLMATVYGVPYPIEEVMMFAGQKLAEQLLEWDCANDEPC